MSTKFTFKTRMCVLWRLKYSILVNYNDREPHKYWPHENCVLCRRLWVTKCDRFGGNNNVLICFGIKRLKLKTVAEKIKYSKICLKPKTNLDPSTFGSGVCEAPRWRFFKFDDFVATFVLPIRSFFTWFRWIFLNIWIISGVF